MEQGTKAELQTMKDDGGAAFPRSAYSGQGHAIDIFEQDGMSLRDWFAGQYLAAIGSLVSDTYQERARSAYLMADAMLAAREAVTT